MVAPDQHDQFQAKTVPFWPTGSQPKNDARRHCPEKPSLVFLSRGLLRSQADDPGNGTQKAGEIAFLDQGRGALHREPAGSAFVAFGPIPLLLLDSQDEDLDQDLAEARLVSLGVAVA